MTFILSPLPIDFYFIKHSGISVACYKLHNDMWLICHERDKKVKKNKYIIYFPAFRQIYACAEDVITYYYYY